MPSPRVHFVCGLLIALLSVSAATCLKSATITWTVTATGEAHATVDPANAKTGMDQVISQAKTYLSAHSADTLVLYFPTATYLFHHPTSPAMYFAGFTSGNLVITGDGTASTILSFDQFDQMGVKIVSSNFVTLSQMLLTRPGLYVTQGDVVSVQPGHVLFQLHPGFPDPVMLFNLGSSASYERTLLGFTHDDPLDPHKDPIYEKVLLSNIQDKGSGMYDATLTNSTLSPPWPVGEWVALKCKSGEQTVRFQDCNDCTIQDLRVTNTCLNALRVVGVCNGVVVQRITIDRSDPINGRAPCFSSPAGGPQVISATRGATVANCTVVATADDGIGYFANDVNNPPTGGLISGNSIRDNQARGILITTSAGGTCQGNTLTRNDQASVLIINIDGAGGVTNWNVTGNTFVEAWDEPVVDVTATSNVTSPNDGISIQGNNFIEAPKNNHLVYVDNSNQVQINNNTVTSFSTVADYSSDTTGNALVYVKAGVSVLGAGNALLQATTRTLGQKVRASDTLNVSWNTAPSLAPIANQNVNAGATLSVTAMATDPDAGQTLIYGLAAGPSGATIDPAKGVIAWRATVASAGTSVSFAVTATDNGSPNLSASQSFQVTVPPLASQPSAVPASAGLQGGAFGLQINGPSGVDYIVEASSDLHAWSTLYSASAPALPFTYTDQTAGNFPSRFYRVRLGP